MKDSKATTVTLFVGVLLIVIFVVGLICSKNPGAFQVKYRYDYTLNQFCAFCTNWWLPAGIVGIPMFLVSLFVSLAKEKKRDSE